MRKGIILFGVGLLVSLVIATVISQVASTQPDGLTYVADHEGFDDTEVNHPLDASPLAGYGGDDTTRKAMAGAIGVLATLALGYIVFSLAKSDKAAPKE